MASTAAFAEVAAMAGDPARAAMLHALMDGRALTASELARIAGIAPQTASGHLSQMTKTGLLAVAKQGRHRYHRLASPGVARMIEGIMRVASELEPPRRHLSVGPRDQALRQARTCYDHLAGRLGVALTDALTSAGYAELSAESGLITERGLTFFESVGIDISAMRQRLEMKSGRLLCRPCLDWSERRSHLAGVVGAALCASSLAQGLVARIDGTRALQITPKGLRIYREKFGVRFE
jgi:DNA-binding transcriptional ArsR family regulator